MLKNHLNIILKKPILFYQTGIYIYLFNISRKDKNSNKKRYMHSKFIALVTRAKTWKRPKYSSRGECIKMWDTHTHTHTHTHTLEYYAAIKKKRRKPFGATWMNLEIIMLNEGSQIKTNIIWYHLHVESEKYKWIYLQNRNKTQTQKATKGKGEVNDKSGVGIIRYALLLLLLLLLSRFSLFIK